MVWIKGGVKKGGLPKAWFGSSKVVFQNHGLGQTQWHSKKYDLGKTRWRSKKHRMDKTRWRSKIMV